MKLSYFKGKKSGQITFVVKCYICNVASYVIGCFDVPSNIIFGNNYQLW